MTRTPEQDVAACRAFALQLQPFFVARVLNDAADQIERLASADTHPKDGDVKQAPLVSGAVGEAETPKGPGQ